ncbi:DUF4145 domain-containing protein [Arthrobacter flavus]
MINTHLQVLKRFDEEIEQGTLWPRPHCRICGEGYVSWEKPVTARNEKSMNDMNHPGWEPEWITGTMHVIGHCDYSECKQTVIGVGRFRVDYATSDLGSDYQGIAYSEFYKVEYFNPPLPLLPLPESVPQDIRDAIDRAAPIIFVDPSSAATVLRAAIELFLTDWGIPAYDPKNRRINLHKRIELWKAATENHQVGEQLLAVKWIGNSGSHEGERLSVRAVVDGLEFIEAAFNELLVAPELKERVRAVNEAKGRIYAK